MADRSTSFACFFLFLRKNFLKLDVYFPVLKFSVCSSDLEQRKAYLLENLFSKWLFTAKNVTAVAFV